MKKHEGVIEGYTFIMEGDDTIEVWGDLSAEFPESYIYVKSGSIKNQTEFEKEISFWFMDNKMNY